MNGMTKYKDIRFHTELEARWAVFFDECGVYWEYSTKQQNLGDGIRYTPQFLLRGLKFFGDLWIDVHDRPGFMDDYDHFNGVMWWIHGNRKQRAKKYQEELNWIIKKGMHPSRDYLPFENFYDVHGWCKFRQGVHLEASLIRQILIVGEMPKCDSMEALCEWAEGFRKAFGPLHYSCHSTEHSGLLEDEIINRVYLPVIDKDGKLTLEAAIDSDKYDVDKTLSAYSKAKNYNFGDKK